jgi:hypothetical protein
MTVTLFLASNSLKTRQSEQVYSHSGETNPLNSTFQVNFTIHFPTDSVRRHCSNVGLQFILVEQIHNVQLLERQKNNEHALHHLSECVLALGGGEWALPLRQLLLGFWVVPVNPQLITCGYLQKEFWASFKPPLKVLAHSDMILLQPYSKQEMIQQAVIIPLPLFVIPFPFFVFICQLQ